MTKNLLFVLVIAALAVPAGALAQGKVSQKDKKKLEKPIKVLVQAVKYGKYDMVLKQLAVGDMAAEMCGKHWAKMSAADKKKFSDNLGTLLKQRFPKFKDQLKYLSAVLFSQHKVQGKDRASVKNTLVVHSKVYKKEYQLTWTLIKKGKKWQGLDLITVGKSFLVKMRDKQIYPLVAKGGIKLVLQKMDAMIAKAKK